MYSISSYDFELPREFIAQLPVDKRHDSKLLVLDKNTSDITHHSFYELEDMLTSDDLLVFNDTKVIPARLLGKKPTGGKAEVFLLEEKSVGDELLWEALVKPGLKIGTIVNFTDTFSAEVVDVLDEGKRLVRFNLEGDFSEAIDSCGQIPLPPYIEYDEQKEDFYKKKYQTVFAKKQGAVAAPTAGLHFSDELLVKLEKKGVSIAFLTLYVGIGTFRPIKCDNYLEHKMHSERYELPQQTIDKINEVKSNKGRVIAVGTTSTRVLEGVYAAKQSLVAGQGSTDVFIYPGFDFKVIDGIITNFHLPKSSLLLMISALVGRDNVFSAYEEAKKNEYRFFSFGDAMMII